MSGNNDRAQRAATAAEAERNAAISQSTGSIRDIFNSPERQAQYDDLYGATRTLGMGDLDKQKKTADLQAKFALARGGQTGGSRANDVGRALGEDYVKGLLEVDRRALAGKADLMGADQQSQNNLIAMAQSGLDMTTASQQASNALRSNLAAGESTRLAGGLGDVFGSVASLKTASDAERIRRQSEKAYGQSMYSPYFNYGGGG
jgi:hypothetical protein